MHTCDSFDHTRPLNVRYYRRKRVVRVSNSATLNLNGTNKWNAGLRWHLYHNATFYPGAGRFQKFEGDVLVKGHQRPAFDQLPRGQSGRWRTSLHIHCRPEAFLGGIYSLCCRSGARVAWQARVLEQSGTRAPAGSHPPSVSPRWLPAFPCKDTAKRLNH